MTTSALHRRRRRISTTSVDAIRARRSTRSEPGSITREERLRSKATNSVAGLGVVAVEGRSSCIGRLPGGGWRATPRPYGRVVASPHRVWILLAKSPQGDKIDFYD